MGCSWTETNLFPTQPVPTLVSRAHGDSGQTQACRGSCDPTASPCLKAARPVKPLPFSWATKAVRSPEGGMQTTGGTL